MVKYMPDKVRRPREELALAVKQLESSGGVVAGSWRREKDTVGDLDVLYGPYHDFGEVVNWCSEMFGYEEIRGGSLKSEGICEYKGKPLNLNLWRVADWDAWGGMILYATGPHDLNIFMRARAQTRGWKLGNGLFDQEGNQLDIGWHAAAKAQGELEDLERDIFKLLDLEYLAPVERENWRGKLIPKTVHADLGKTVSVHSSRAGHAPHEVRCEKQADGTWKAVECDCEWFTYNTSKGKKPCRHMAEGEKKANG